MTNLHVLVCDDVEQSATRLSQRLMQHRFLSVKSLSTDELKKQLDVLTDRQQLCRKPKTNKIKHANESADASKSSCGCIT